MAKVVITKTGNSVDVVFNDYAGHPNINAKCRSYDIRDIVEIELAFDESHVVVMMRDAHGNNTWPITYDSSYTGEDYFIVDSIDGNTPSSNEDLFNKLSALR